MVEGCFRLLHLREGGWKFPPPQHPLTHSKCIVTSLSCHCSFIIALTDHCLFPCRRQTKLIFSHNKITMKNTVGKEEKMKLLIIMHTQNNMHIWASDLSAHYPTYPMLYLVVYICTNYVINGSVWEGGNDRIIIFNESTWWRSQIQEKRSENGF